MERACKEMGLSMNAAFTIFAKVARERRIPFVDSFYSRKSRSRLTAVSRAEGREGMVRGLVEDA